MRRACLSLVVMACGALYFSTFFGGSTQDWASPRQQSVDFDDLIVSLTPISH